jgi:hypothetical protein
MLAAMRMVLVVLLAVVGCVDSEPAALPRCTQMQSCEAVIVRDGDAFLLCGKGGDITASCAQPGQVWEDCAVERDEPCVCSFRADGTVAALCHRE